MGNRDLVIPSRNLNWQSVIYFDLVLKYNWEASCIPNIRGEISEDTKSLWTNYGWKLWKWWNNLRIPIDPWENMIGWLLMTKGGKTELFLRRILKTINKGLEFSLYLTLIYLNSSSHWSYLGLPESWQTLSLSKMLSMDRKGEWINIYGSCQSINGVNSGGWNWEDHLHRNWKGGVICMNPGPHQRTGLGRMIWDGSGY